MLTDIASFKKILSLAPGSASLGSVSTSTSSLLMKHLCSSLDHSCCRPHQLGLMPFVFGVQELSLVTWNKSPLLHQPCQRFSVGFQNCEFEIVWKVFVVSLPPVRVDQMLIKSRFGSDLFAFAVELGDVLFARHGNACFSLILRNNMHIWCIQSHLLVFQPWGSLDMRLCSRCRFFCSWSCS